MSAHRNPRRRKRSNALDGSRYFAPIAAGILLSENPNRAKHGAARLDILDAVGTERIAAARKDYRALTVVTEIRTDRAGRKLSAARIARTSYTI